MTLINFGLGVELCRALSSIYMNWEFWSVRLSVSFTYPLPRLSCGLGTDNTNLLRV